MATPIMFLTGALGRPSVATGHFLHSLLADLLIVAVIVIVVLRPDEVGVVAAAFCLLWLSSGS